MAEERNERWVYVALGILALAYVVYRYHDSIDISPGRIGKLAPTLGYAIAPLFAVLTQVWRRKKSKEAKEAWQKGILQEGLVREERAVTARFVNGKLGGSFTADVTLTRAALYVFDVTGRRDPMRFPLSRERQEEFGVVDVEMTPAERGGRSTVRIRVTGPSSYTIRFESAHGEWWWIDVRRRLGMSTDRSLLEREVEYEEVEDEPVVRWPWAGGQ